MSIQPAGSQLLRSLLREYNEHPDERERIETEIEQRFQRPLAILVIDSYGFSRTVRDKGIIYFLAILERLERLIVPTIERHGGRLLRREADNFFAVFPDAPTAVACAAEICHNVDVANEPLPAPNEIYVSIGIGCGDVLVIGDADIFGDEMNVACKLGEDLAQHGEILLTAGAREALGDSPWEFQEVNFSVSGLDLVAYRLVR